MNYLTIIFVIFMVGCHRGYTWDAYIIPDDNYYMEGDTVVILCTVKDYALDMEKVKMIFKGNNQTEIDLPFRRTGEHTLKTVLQNIGLEDNGTIFCAIDRRTLAKQTFFVQAKPTIPEIDCWYNYGGRNLNCSWTAAQSTCWSFKYRIANRNKNFSSCTIDGPSSASCSCYDWYCARIINPSPGFYSAICSFDPFEDKNVYNTFYEVLINGRKITSTVSREWPLAVDWSIVKLEPVSNLTTNYVSSNAVDISWSVSNYPCEYQLSCNIVSHIRGNSTVKTSTITASCSENPTLLNTTLYHLYPNTSYVISVSCREFGSKFWSDEQSLTLRTSPAVPVEGPVVDAGSFTTYECQAFHKCTLLYLKPPNGMRNGYITGYRINMMDTNGNNVTHTFGKVATTNLTLPYTASNEINVHIWSKNVLGYSRYSSELDITGYDSDIPQIQCLKTRKVKDTNGTSIYHVSWSSVGAVPQDVNVTYYFCLGFVTENKEIICESNFDWIKRYSSHGFSENLTVPISSSLDEVSSWHFGISLSRNNKSNGINWDIASCSDTKNKTSPAVLYACFVILLVPLITIIVLCARAHKSWTLKEKNLIDTEFIKMCNGSSDQINENSDERYFAEHYENSNHENFVGNGNTAQEKEDNKVKAEEEKIEITNNVNNLNLTSGSEHRNSFQNIGMSFSNDYTTSVDSYVKGNMSNTGQSDNENNKYVRSTDIYTAQEYCEASTAPPPENIGMSFSNDYKTSVDSYVKGDMSNPGQSDNENNKYVRSTDIYTAQEYCEASTAPPPENKPYIRTTDEQNQDYVSQDYCQATLVSCPR